MMEIIQLLWLLIGTLIGQIIILLIGYTILYFLPNNKDFPPLQKFSISYGIGTGFICLSMFFCILIGVQSRVSFFPLLIIIMSLFTFFKIWKILKKDIKKILALIKRQKFSALEWFCIFLLTFELIYISIYWFIYPIYTWDAIAIWDARAKYIFYDGNFEYLTYVKTHPSYPILVPLNLTFFYSIFFQYHYFAKILFASYFIFLIIFFYYSLRFFKLNRIYSLLISLLFGSTGIIFSHAITAYADLTLTFFYSLATIFLFYYFSTEKQYYLLYSSIFMGFMAWTKIEGIGLLSINVGILILYHIFKLLKKEIDLKNALKKVIIYPIVCFIIFLPWQVICIFNNFNIEYISNIANIFDFQNTFSDIITILNFIIIEVLNTFKLNNLFFIFWFFSIIILILNIKLIFNEKIFFLFLLCFFHFLLYIVIYIITPSDLEWQLHTSFNRMILHLMPIYCFLIGIIFSNSERNLVDLKEESLHKKITYFFIAITILFITCITLFNDYINNILDVFRTFLKDFL